MPLKDLELRTDSPINLYSAYLKQKYKRAAYRVAVDGGFSCPNRPGGRSSAGCAYCDPYGAAAVYNRREGYGDLYDRFSGETKEIPALKTNDIKTQINKALGFLKTRYKAEIFLLYFQSFSSTNGESEDLRNIYASALDEAEFRELIVSTRPDCIDEEKADMLASFKNKVEVWTELGLQTIRDETLKRINRGHSFEDFKKSFSLLRERGIKICVHIIFGLPGEDWKEMEQTVLYLAEAGPDAIKFHNLHIPLDTALYWEFMKGEIAAPGAEQYMEYLIRALELIPPEIIVQRMTCDTPKIRRAAPRHFWKKTYFYDRIINEMRQRNTFQGRRYTR